MSDFAPYPALWISGREISEEKRPADLDFTVQPFAPF